MADVTAIYSLPYPEGTDFIEDGPAKIQELAEAVDPLLTPFTQGALASRPVSSPGTPGIAGRNYRATDGANAGRVFRDYGTGWEEMTVQRSPEPTLKMIRGTVNSDGTTSEGAGFTSVKNATGAYTVTFTVAFSDAPSVTVAGRQGDWVAILGGLPNVAFQDVATRAAVGGANADSGFCFIAVGPA